MPVNKNALLRYRVIDSCLTNKYRKYPSAETILEKVKQHLEVDLSKSMLDKDFRQMKEIYSAPIKFDRTRGGYYYTEEKFSIMEFPLTQEEIEALDYSTALLQQVKGTEMFRQFENAINKVIEGYRISKIIGKSESQILQVEEPVNKTTPNGLEEVLKAIVHKKLLLIIYKPYGRLQSEHKFSPYLLKEYRNRWYVIGHSATKNNIIVLALDRIEKLEEAKGKYISDASFSPDEFFRYSFGITQVHDAKPERVVLEFDPVEAPYIISQPLHHSQKCLSEEDSDTYRVELNVYLTAELKMAILSFGKDVKVLEPKSLRKELENCIKEMSSLYSG
jgi:predicted DNA-binding transcriptional regulator YafY